jgi:hypothetical protein
VNKENILACQEEISAWPRDRRPGKDENAPIR